VTERITRSELIRNQADEKTGSDQSRQSGTRKATRRRTKKNRDGRLFIC